MHRPQIALCFTLLSLSPVFAQPTTAPSRPTTALTIYATGAFDNFDATQMLQNGQVPGFAVVQQRRTLDLQEGENSIDLPDIATTADFSTLSLRPIDADGFKVLSQTLRERVADPDAILRRAIGHEIIINRRQAGGIERARAPETINAKLLAFDQNQLVIETNNRQLPVQIIPRNAEIAEIKLMADSAAATTRPALACKIFARQTGPQEALLTYHVNKMTWHADYEILLRDDKPTAHFSSAISIVNRSGAAFDDAAVNLLRRGNSQSASISYPLPKSANLPANAAQRVPLFDALNIPSQIVLACGPLDYAHTPTSASTYLAIDNTSKNHLGLALPPGRVRVSRQTGASAPILLSDESFAPVDANNLILLRIGPASAVNVNREVQRRLDTDRGVNVDSIQITLRNRAQQPQRVLLVEPTPAANCEVLEKSDAFEKQSQAMTFTVDVPASGERIVTYSIRHPAQ